MPLSRFTNRVKRLPLRSSAWLLLAAAAVGCFAVRAQRMVSDGDILVYLNRTITWYRDVSAVQEFPASSRELLLAESLRQDSLEALQFTFDFARAQAAIPSAARSNEAEEDDRSRRLAQREATVEQQADRLAQQIADLDRQLQHASPGARRALAARRETLAAVLNLTKARLENLHGVLGFLATPEEGGLAAKISELERSVPQAARTGQKKAAATANTAATAGAKDFRPETAGIVGLTTGVFSLSSKMSRLSGLIRETDDLRQAGQTLRLPLRNSLQAINRRAEDIAQSVGTADEAEATAGKKELDGLLARYKQLSAGSAPLSQQSGEINATRAGLVEWRNDLREDYSSAVRYLLLRLGMLAVAIGIIFLFSELWRRATMRYIQDLRRRRQFLLLRRIVVGCTIGLFVALSFVTEFGSLATFAGFLAAGIAVAMQSVLLSVVAYFFLAGRWGVRVGDRVTISGVTGDVVDIGLFRLFLMELNGGGAGFHPTGRVVVFPNAVLFQPSAIFKQIPEMDYLWRTLTVTLGKESDRALVEQRLLAAVDSVYSEYRDSIERKHKAALTSLNMQAAAPRPESRYRFSDSGLEFTIRYPVESKRAAEIDDRMTRELINAFEREPRLTLADGSTPKVQIS
jgi:small-conductance mechanosensitive channel